MTKLQWLSGKRYELSADGIGLLKYILPTEYYHIHKSEMTQSEKFKHRALLKSKG